MEIIIDLLKISLPAIVVAVTVYFMMKQYFDNQQKIESLNFRKNMSSTTIPLRLGAYERLSLFCERISIPALIMRVRAEETTSAHLRMALMVAVQQEFEHNITQQVYVSDNLWKIVKIARDDVMNTINLVYQTVDPDSDSREFSRALYDHLNEKEILVLDKALVAVKQEAGLLLN